MKSAITSIRSLGLKRADLVAWVWQVLLFTTVYVVVGRLGMQLYQLEDSAVPFVWLPTGLSLAVLILFGRRLWPGIFIGTLLVGLSSSYGWILLLGGAIGNTLESVVGVTLLIRVANFRPNLERMQDGAAFMLIGVLGCTTISATIGSVSMLLSGDVAAADFGLMLLFWWLGTVGGALVLTPILLMFVHGAPSWTSLIRRFESWLALVILLVIDLSAFFGPDLGLLGFGASVAPFPILVWAGIRLGPRGAVMASFLIILVATLATGAGSGPFVSGSPSEAKVLLWAYSMFIGITAFTLAAVVEQHAAAERRFRLGERERLRVEKEKLLLIERERMTREMHDGLGGQLVSALSMVEREMAAPDEVAEVLRRAIDDIRIVIDSLDPDTMDLPTSLGKLRARLEPMLGRNGIDLRWSIEDIAGLEAFPPEASLHVLRIIQEAVMNTLNHADANSVEVKITSSDAEGRQMDVSIRDNGRGVSPVMPSGGRGIKNMKSRAKDLGAKIRIDGTRAGTQIVLAVPIPR